MYIMAVLISKALFCDGVEHILLCHKKKQKLHELVKQLIYYRSSENVTKSDGTAWIR